MLSPQVNSWLLWATQDLACGESVFLFGRIRQARDRSNFESDDGVSCITECDHIESDTKQE